VGSCTAIGIGRFARPAFLIAAELLAALILVLAASPASAQFFFDNRFTNGPARPGRAVQQQSQWFWPWQQWQQPVPRQVLRRMPRQAPPLADFSQAPPPRKQDTPPTTRVVVMGDSMADWLAYGFENAVSETPEIGVVRKVRFFSGLLRGETRDAYDWPLAARETLAAEAPDFVVMMIGLADRQTIGDRQIRNAAQQRAMQQSHEPPQPGQTPSAAGEQPQGALPDDKAAPAATRYEFRSEKWGEFYGKRIDDTIAALKSKGVPVLWVGLPAIRGTKSTADIAYLDDLYRRHAEKAGIIYVDVWDGFVDEDGDFALYGPDFEGQTRRLRTGDGVYFTKAGAVKLGQYVERELKRVILARATPAVVPAPETAQTPTPCAPPRVPARPLAGPVVPLTATESTPDELLGGGPPKPADPIATRVLVRGAPIAAPTGRADDFVWPRPERLPGPVAGEPTLDPASPTLSPGASSKPKRSAASAFTAPRARPKHVSRGTTPRFVERPPWQFGAIGPSAFWPVGPSR
jgi:uncharacterized protein